MLENPCPICGRDRPETVDPVKSAERALSHIPTNLAHVASPGQLGEAIRELAHGLAACERRRRDGRAE